MKGDIKSIAILAVSFLVGIVAFIFTHTYLSAQLKAIKKMRDDIAAAQETVLVMVAASDLTRGTVIQEDDLGTRNVPRSILSSEPVTLEHAEGIIGRKLRHSVDQYGPILWAFVDTPDGPGGGLAPSIRRRLRAVSISVGGAAAVSGHVRPADRVDVLGTFSLPTGTEGEMEVVTMTILQNVTILATGDQTARSRSSLFDSSKKRSRGYSMVTLEVTPEEAELLVFAEYMKGRMTLALRNPEDMHYLKDKSLGRVDFTHLSTKIPEYNERRQRVIMGR